MFGLKNSLNFSYFYNSSLRVRAFLFTSNRKSRAYINEQLTELLKNPKEISRGSFLNT